MYYVCTGTHHSPNYLTQIVYKLSTFMLWTLNSLVFEATKLKMMIYSNELDYCSLLNCVNLLDLNSLCKYVSKQTMITCTLLSLVIWNQE